MIHSENTLTHVFLVIFRMNHTFIKIFMETTHEIASVGGLYHNYAEDRSDEVLEMVVHVCIFFVHN